MKHKERQAHTRFLCKVSSFAKVLKFPETTALQRYEVVMPSNAAKPRQTAILFSQNALIMSNHAQKKAKSPPVGGVKVGC
jgi:hypothetical protein